jgi:hypothetical protein
VFFAVSVLLCLTSNLVNGLVTVNAPALMGALGVDSDQMAWLPTVYSMTFIGMNLLLVRFRQQFGLRLYTLLGMTACCIVTAFHLIIRSFTGAVVVHAAAGVAAAPLSALAVYYMMEAMPRALTVTGVVLALGFEQVSTPLARLISTGLIDYDQWRSLYLFEFGLTALCLGCVGLFPLPPSEKGVARFRLLDIVTFALLASGLALICAVLGMGTALWWTDRDWLGWALAAAMPLVGLALLVEARRSHPLIDLGWLSAPTMLRFAVVAVVSRIVFGEQSSATAFLGVMGLDNHELHLFALVLAIATVAGTLAAAAVFRPNRNAELAALAIGLVAVAAFHDSHSTNLTRATEFYVSQGVIAFATALFMGPALLFGFTRVIQAGGGPLASFLVLFTGCQNIGGLAGSALLGSFQIIREKANSASLASTVTAIDPSTADRIATGGGVGALQGAATREANVLAYNNVFLLVAAMAAVTTLYFVVVLTIRWRASAHAQTRIERA